MRVMIVDDERLVRKGIISSIPWTKYGFEIAAEAGNGEKALEQLESTQIDLLVTDLSMPVMSGFELMREARKRHPHLQVVVLTCHQDFKYIQDAMRLGAMDYIVKTELEDEVIEAALARISKQFDKAVLPSAGSTVTEDMQLPEEAWSTLRGAWSGLNWIYDEEAYRSGLAALELLQGGVRPFRTLFYYLIADWERMIPNLASADLMTKLEACVSWESCMEWLKELRAGTRKRLQRTSYPQAIVSGVLAVMEELVVDPGKITQDEAARRIHLSRSYFSQCFKDIVGKPFGEYIKALRFEKAKTLLLGTDLPISQIAETCGFLDHRYFSKVFREETGVVPSEFRSKAGAAGVNNNHHDEENRRD